MTLACILRRLAWIVFPLVGHAGLGGATPHRESARGQGASLDFNTTFAYFEEIVFGSEFQNLEPIVRKWVEPIRIRVFGDPTARDLDALFHTIRDLKSISSGIPPIQVVSENQNVSLHFLPKSEFHKFGPQKELAEGYFFIRFNDRHEIYQGRILISTESNLTQVERNHLVREELTQTLGLINDSPLYLDSIFQVEWTLTEAFSELDKELIRMLYHPEVKCGMDREALLKILRPGDSESG